MEFLKLTTEGSERLRVEIKWNSLFRWKLHLDDNHRLQINSKRY